MKTIQYAQKGHWPVKQPKGAQREKEAYVTLPRVEIPLQSLIASQPARSHLTRINKTLAVSSVCYLAEGFRYSTKNVY